MHVHKNMCLVPKNTSDPLELGGHMVYGPHVCAEMYFQHPHLQDFISFVFTRIFPLTFFCTRNFFVIINLEE